MVPDVVPNEEILEFQKEDMADTQYITNVHRGSRKMPVFKHLSASAATRRNTLAWNDKTIENPTSYGPG